MGRTKDLHLRQQRDRGQGWDKSLFDGNPNELTTSQLQEQLAKRGLATEGNFRALRNRFIRALCVGVPVGRPKPSKPAFEDPSGKTLYFECPDADSAHGCLDIEKRGRLLRYHDADIPTWTTLLAVFPVPVDTRLCWSFHTEKLYNLVVGVAREDAEVTRMLGSDDRGWGYFVTLGSKHFNDDTGIGLPYGVVGKTGCCVTVTMDTKAGSLEFAMDGKPLGEAFNGIFGPVYPAVSLCGLNVVHVGNERVLPAVALPEDGGPLTAIALASECRVQRGGQVEGLRFDTNVAVQGGTLMLTPLAFGVTFQPAAITVMAGETRSEAVIVSASPTAKVGPIPVNVLLKRGPGVTNGGPGCLVCDGLSIEPEAPAEVAEKAAAALPSAPGLEEGEERSPKRQRTDPEKRDAPENGP
eukprot:GGOE01043841.1.p1 GENE.GGOE01043841.1~~GGOE01043841.1.p1  ORF type:complete len:411 (-),score=119.47 GGOE01043841.1:54-1286(-)